MLRIRFAYTFYNIEYVTRYAATHKPSFLLVVITTGHTVTAATIVTNFNK